MTHACCRSCSILLRLCFFAIRALALVTPHLCPMCRKDSAWNGVGASLGWARAG